MKQEIKFVGVGGQGVLLASGILAKSASVLDGLFAVMTDKYTSDMRGGEVSSDVILSSARVTYPLIENPDFLIALSQDACDTYAPRIHPGGTLIYDSGLASPSGDTSGIRTVHAPFNAIASDDFANRNVMNMMVLGFVCVTLRSVNPDSLRKTMAEMLDPKYVDLNLEAFGRGLVLGAKRDAGGAV